MPSTVISSSQGTTTTFRGFEPLTANYVYCPNQFLDVCLPHCSRGTVRLVAYMLRRTLGWLDENGDPIEQSVSVTYRELIAEARISRRAIREAIDDAIAGGFIRCLETARPKSQGQAAHTAMLTLRWDAGNQYASNPKLFRGFYAGEGHRTPIPNAFFDAVVPAETLTVVKVVGTVLRHTVGYQNQFGGRRSQAPLSYNVIQRYANIRHRKTLADALRNATKSGYICCMSPGFFDPSGGKDSRPARYAMKWLDEAKKELIGVKIEPEIPKRCKNRIGIGVKIEPGKRCKYRTDINTDHKDILKQQQTSRGVIPATSAADFSNSIQILCDEGFDEKVARDLSRVSSFGEIQKQIVWIDLRKPLNRLGMLRTAIEQKWGEPVAVKKSEANQHSRERERAQDSIRAASNAARTDQVRKRDVRRKALLEDWRSRPTEERKQYHNNAVAEALSTFDRTQLRRYTNLDDPPMATLEVMSRALGIAKVS